MTITGATKAEIFCALGSINNNIYDNNIETQSLDCLNKKGTRWKIRLKSKDCNKAGSRHRLCTRLDGEYRRTASACWHTHGNFFEELLKMSDCKIYTGGNKVTRSGGNWNDWKYGSMMNTLYMSEMCEC